MTFIYCEITYTQRERDRKGNKYEQVDQVQPRPSALSADNAHLLGIRHSGIMHGENAPLRLTSLLSRDAEAVTYRIHE